MARRYLDNIKQCFASPQERVDFFFASIPTNEALRLLDFFKSKHADPLRAKFELKKVNRSKGPNPEESKNKAELTKAIGK